MTQAQVYVLRKAVETARAQGADEQKIMAMTVVIDQLAVGVALEPAKGQEADRFTRTPEQNQVLYTEALRKALDLGVQLEMPPPAPEPAATLPAEAGAPARPQSKAELKATTRGPAKKGKDVLRESEKAKEGEADHDETLEEEMSDAYDPTREGKALDRARQSAESDFDGPATNSAVGIGGGAGGTEGRRARFEAHGGPATLKVLVHQNPPMVAFLEAFNKKFMEKYPNVTVDMSVVNANDLSTVTQTRLTANDVDVVDMFGFANAAQPYMKKVDPPNWQTLIEAGYLLDISDQPFVKNYDPSASKDAGTYNGKVYEINLGRMVYSGIYYNKSLFEANNVKVPTTWSELVTACETFTS